MLMLLAVSTLAAALIPPQARRQVASSTTSTTTTPPTSAATGGRLVERTVRVAGRGSTRVMIRLGDQLALTVRVGFPDQVSIPAFGLIADATSDAPAHFDLLPDRTGRFDVELVERGRVAAVIEVASKREPDKAP